MEKKINLQITCAACEELIIAGAVQENPAAVEHLQQCRACREFAEFQTQLLNTPPLIPQPLPSWQDIRREHTRRQRHKSRILRFALLPAAAAAAAMVAVGGFYWQMQPAEVREIPQSEYKFINDVSSFAAALEECSVTLAWDNSSVSESATRHSMEKARTGSSQWQIELFNPYNLEEQ